MSSPTAAVGWLPSNFGPADAPSVARAAQRLLDELLARGSAEARAWRGRSLMERMLLVQHHGEKHELTLEPSERVACGGLAFIYVVSLGGGDQPPQLQLLTEGGGADAPAAPLRATDSMSVLACNGRVAQMRFTGPFTALVVLLS